MILLSESQIALFWAKVDRRGADDCWLWTASRFLKGCGQMRINGRIVRATHISLQLAGRPRIDHLHALHSCDTPLCCNPAHLRWGTNKENVNDKMSRGRCGAAGVTWLSNFKIGLCGEKNPQAKITECDVVAIRSSQKSKFELAEIYGLHPNTIYKIKARLKWAHVDAVPAVTPFG